MKPPCNGKDFVARDIPQYEADGEEPAYHIRLALPVNWDGIDKPCWYCMGCEREGADHA